MTWKDDVKMSENVTFKLNPWTAFFFYFRSLVWTINIQEAIKRHATCKYIAAIRRFKENRDWMRCSVRPYRWRQNVGKRRKTQISVYLQLSSSISRTVLTATGSNLVCCEKVFSSPISSNGGRLAARVSELQRHKNRKIKKIFSEKKP